MTVLSPAHELTSLTLQGRCISSRLRHSASSRSSSHTSDSGVARFVGVCRLLLVIVVLAFMPSRSSTASLHREMLRAIRPAAPQDALHVVCWYGDMDILQYTLLTSLSPDSMFFLSWEAERAI